MPLADRVQVSRRFQRAVRIDTDFGDALEGYVCPRSSTNVLENMAHQVSESGQGAFTWTGPYGSGKSSLAVAFGAVLGGKIQPEPIFGRETSSILKHAFPPRPVLPVVGRRERPATVIGEAISNLTTGRKRRNWTEKQALDAIGDISTCGPGLLVLIDEMGKFLEAAARDGSDIHVFQQLAEIASRSGGRLILVGILHQAFEEYAHRLSREMRSEWSKIQGRFMDLAVNAGGEEQIDLLGRAIESDRMAEPAGALAEGVARLSRKSTSPHLAKTLEDCWPLHPIAACLLGPISRRRFGQNQRSVFGFLNSAEPEGFQDFILNAGDDDLYGPDRLWDYLRINLESAILASPDGHRWALGVDALGRCEALGGEALHLRLLKTVAIADLVKDRSRLPPSDELLKYAAYDCERRKIDDALEQLQQWSLIVFRKFADAYSLFEGSDFDIERAVEQASESEVDFEALNSMARLQPIVAKRHYHETGALRWFDVRIVSLAQSEEEAVGYRPRNGAIGAFFLAIPTQGESEDEAKAICRRIAKRSRDMAVVVGLSRHSWSIPASAIELLALERVRDESVELQGDRVGRIEIQARIAGLQAQLEIELERAFDRASWFHGDAGARTLRQADLNSFASDLAEDMFPCAPHLPNELLNRTKPSSSASAARNSLLKRMVQNEGEERLGIDGYPAELGLFASLLEATKLYRPAAGDAWQFAPPPPRKRRFS